jgi:hypothetical protein
MNIEQIRFCIERIEKSIFIDSIKRISVGVIRELQKEVERLKGFYLEISFMDIESVELEEIRFKLQEVSICISISIKENLKCDIRADIRKLESLYRLHRV